MLKYPPSTRVPQFLHGGDYNPDQWQATPATWQEDLRLMKLAGCNCMSLGIFSWASLEPEEGRYTFGWLDTIMDALAANGAYAVLATPTAAPPAWLSAKYPETLRTPASRVRNRHSNRVNQCLTAPRWREKIAGIARALATRYQEHPALIMWHVHNEYGGECHCELCQEAFRGWLKRKYGTLDALNAAYWSAFWGHTYTAWSQLESGDWCVHGLTLDWKRFITEQTIATYQAEAQVLRAITPGIPVTTNTYWFFVDYDGRQWAKVVDVLAQDSYPQYHERADQITTAVGVSFASDFYRGLRGGQPFLLMESTPSSANWMPVNRLKRPGMHRLQSLQHIAHGADSVQYFQWRASRGACEKFHGAVVAHDGTEHTRVFKDVADLGALLKKLAPVVGASVPAEVAVIYDKEVDWAITAAAGPRHEKRAYDGTCMAHYRAFWQQGIPVDVIAPDLPLERYKLVVAPMLYLMRAGLAERLTAFVKAGGTLVTTYWSGIADENDLAFLGGRPGPLRPLLGIWSEELDVLYDDEAIAVKPVRGAGHGLRGSYPAKIFCDLVHAEGAQVLATYTQDFYAGRPAVTVNRVGKGAAYYLAFRGDEQFHADFYGSLRQTLGLRRVLELDLPTGVTVQRRTDGERDYVFVLNVTNKAHTLTLPAAHGLTNLETGKALGRILAVPAYASHVLVRAHAMKPVKAPMAKVKKTAAKR